MVPQWNSCLTNRYKLVVCLAQSSIIRNWSLLSYICILCLPQQTTREHFTKYFNWYLTVCKAIEAQQQWHVFLFSCYTVFALFFFGQLHYSFTPQFSRVQHRTAQLETALQFYSNPWSPLNGLNLAKPHKHSHLTCCKSNNQPWIIDSWHKDYQHP